MIEARDPTKRYGGTRKAGTIPDVVLLAAVVHDWTAHRPRAFA
jgi:hypothetical protein